MGHWMVIIGQLGLIENLRESFGNQWRITGGQWSSIRLTGAK